MGFLAMIEQKWKMLCDKTAPARAKCRRGTQKVSHYCSVSWRYIYLFRTVILAIPVAIGAIILAIRNASILPDNVGINLQTDGSYTMVVPKMVAIMGPLAVTALCVLLMLCSKRTLYPWLISLFSLALPIIILLTNVYPA